jgi:2',3'-cyclic-nucleotide 2'-phosphodiesterase (5'-nucleotidase family)
VLLLVIIMSELALNSPDATESSSSGRVHLRILSINDVYELDNFPHLASAKRIESIGPNLTISLLAGDFVAPSLLSSIDHGHAKVDCMNMSGVDYVCIGNHENDVTLDQLFDRMRESKFTWINSNMELDMPKDIGTLPKFVPIAVSSAMKNATLDNYNADNIDGLSTHSTVIDTGFPPASTSPNRSTSSSDDSVPSTPTPTPMVSTLGAHNRTIAMIGLNTDDASVYTPSRFGACVIHDVNTTAAEYYRTLMQSGEYDTVVPMTHQSVSRDIQLAKMKVGFPVIIGGHDHVEYNVNVEGTHIVKTSIDGALIAVTDLIWETPEQEHPHVTVTLKPAKSYPRDPLVEELANSHNMLTKSLEDAVVFEIAPDVRLSSKGMRLRQTSMVSMCRFVVPEYFLCMP